MKNIRRIGKCAYVEEYNVFFNPCNLCDLNKERKKDHYLNMVLIEKYVVLSVIVLYL